MQYNNNINNISPPSNNNNNVNIINNSLSPNIPDAISIYNDEATNTNNSREVSDMPALLQQIDDTMNRRSSTIINISFEEDISTRIPSASTRNPLHLLCGSNSIWCYIFNGY
eukprot:542473_1